MPDRITLIAQIGAEIQKWEAAGVLETVALLRAALQQLVEDAALAAGAEKRKLKDRNRKKGSESKDDPPTEETATAFSRRRRDAQNGKSQHSTVSTESADSVGSPSPMVSLLPPEPPNNTSLPQPPDNPSGAGRSEADDPPETANEPASPTRAAFLHFDPDARIPDRASPALIRAGVNYVLDRYAKHHPRRRPGEKERRLIARHLRTYTPRELATAVDGNAEDDWAKSIGKHELTFVLRDNGQIDNWRARAEKSEESEERTAREIETTGWLPEPQTTR